MSNWLVSVALVASVVSGQASAQPAVLKRNPTHGARLAPFQAFVPVDSWFSYDAPKKAPNARKLLSDISAAEKADVAFGDVAEEIIVVGERQRRDFALSRPSDELTGPRALEAAQPMVPWPGSTCTYKNLCYDLSQPPLRATLPRLAEALFGN